MAIWKDNTAVQPPANPAATREPARFDTPSKPELVPKPVASPAPTATSTPLTMPAQDHALPRQESLVAADITIEGKIEGRGSVRIAGKFKGDVNVQGDLTVETGAKLTGSVRANRVTIAGELEGNVEGAAVIDLLASGIVTGDVKTGSLTVAAGARMRGQADFGWSDDKVKA
jgi:cytoskeletal protein CcmA (bactofilin family)